MKNLRKYLLFHLLFGIFIPCLVYSIARYYFGLAHLDALILAMVVAYIAMVVAYIESMMAGMAAGMAAKDMKLKKSFTITITIITGVITFFLLYQQLFIFK